MNTLRYYFFFGDCLFYLKKKTLNYIHLYPKCIINHISIIERYLKNYNPSKKLIIFK